MRKYVYDVDADGFINDIYLATFDDAGVMASYTNAKGDEVKPDKDFVTVDLPQPLLFHKPKWTGSEWIEGATQEEIEEITGSTLDVVKIRKINELDELCKKTILGRFKVVIDEIEYEFSYDAEAQSRFNGFGLLFFANKIYEIEWTAYENEQRVRILLNQSNFDIVSLAALHHQNLNVTKYNQLLQQVNEATTKEQVEAIVW